MTLHLDAQEFEYRYEIFDQQFSIVAFVLDLTHLDPADVLASGSRPEEPVDNLIKKTKGSVGYYSKEEAAALGLPELAPRLLLE